MPGFNIECYSWQKLIKKEYSLLQILNLSLPKRFKGNFVNNTQNSSENSKPFWRLRFGRGLVVCPPSNGEGLRDIHHSMSMALDTKFHTWFIMTHIITKCDSYFITKCDRSLLQNAAGFLFESAIGLLQNATVITNRSDFITNCDNKFCKGLRNINHSFFWINFQAKGLQLY